MKLEKQEIEIIMTLLNNARLSYQEHMNLNQLRNKLVEEYKNVSGNNKEPSGTDTSGKTK